MSKRRDPAEVKRRDKLSVRCREGMPDSTKVILLVYLSDHSIASLCLSVLLFYIAGWIYRE